MEVAFPITAQRKGKQEGKQKVAPTPASCMWRHGQMATTEP